MQITVKAPATIANFGPGFDVFGMCIDHPFDGMVFETTRSGLTEIFCTYEKGGKDISEKKWDRGILKNTAGLAALAVRRRFIEKYPAHTKKLAETDFRIKIVKGYRAASGLGSSAASAAGAAFAAHALLRHETGCSLTPRDLAECAAEGEGAAGGVHPDNTTPCLFGGFTIAVTPEIKYETVPWEREQYKRFKTALSKYIDKKQGFRRFVPPEMYFSIVFPDIKLPTKEMRQLLADLKGERYPSEEQFSENVKQVRGVAWGFAKGRYKTICENLKDEIVTPARKVKVPSYDEMEHAAMRAGDEKERADAFILCGSGPCVAAVSNNKAKARIIMGRMLDVCARNKTKVLESFIAEPNLNGVEVLYDNFGFKKNTAKSGAELLEKLK